jgi:uncharacterized protein YktB (UPF0637 family)
MEFSGFTKEDFDVFTIDGFEDRMEALKSTIRPKLETLGNHFAPTLTTITGDEMFPHVAKHARRSVNPPKDTWVAFARNARGYKMLPHFQIGMWESHLFIWYAVIYEAAEKAEIAKSYEKNVASILKQIPSHFVWSIDHMKPGAIPQNELEKKGLLDLFQKVQNVKKAELLCGLHIDKEDVINMPPQELIAQIDQTFRTLLPLYKIS